MGEEEVSFFYVKSKEEIRLTFPRSRPKGQHVQHLQLHQTSFFFVLIFRVKIFFFSRSVFEFLFLKFWKDGVLCCLRIF